MALFRSASPWLLALISPALALAQAPELVYRSELLARTAGAPNSYHADFEACDPAGAFRLVLDNGPDGGTRAASVEVLLNRVPVVLPADLNQNVSRVERAVRLQSANRLDVTLAGQPGARVRVTVDGPMRCLRVRLTSPPAGSVLREPGTLVAGEIEARGPVGLRLRMSATLDGRLVEVFVPVEMQGGRFAAWAPLPPGEVRLVALASDPAGRTAEDAVTVTFQPDRPGNDRPAQLEASPTVGFAPLTVTFGGVAATDPDVDLLELDVDGDGAADFGLTEFAGPPHQVTYTYAAEGLYVATMVIRDRTTGESVTARAPINVIPVPDLRVIWDGFRAALGRGDAETALRFVADEAREGYRRVLDDLAGDLPAVAADLPDITPQVVTPGYGTAGTTRLKDDGRL
jgi:hypothetical protein